MLCSYDPSEKRKVSVFERTSIFFFFFERSEKSALLNFLLPHEIYFFFLDILSFVEEKWQIDVIFAKDIANTKLSKNKLSHKAHLFGMAHICLDRIALIRMIIPFLRLGS
jgi:hypothetical protein